MSVTNVSYNIWKDIIQALRLSASLKNMRRDTLVFGNANRMYHMD